LSQLEQQISQAKTKLIQLQSESKPTQLQEQKLEQLQAQYSSTQATQTAYHAAAAAIALCASFAISGGEFQSATEVIAALQQQVHRLSTIANAASLPNWQTTGGQFNQIPAAAVVNTWWTWVCHSLSAEQPRKPVTGSSPACYLWFTGSSNFARPNPLPPLAIWLYAHRLYSQDSLTPTISPKSYSSGGLGPSGWSVSFSAPLLLSRVAMVIYLVCITVVAVFRFADFRS